MDTAPSAFGWRKGAGEELTFCIGQSPIVLPGQSVPFVGVVGQSRVERLRLLDQIRAFRRHAAPTGKWRRRTTDRTAGPNVSFSSPPATRHETDDEAPQEAFMPSSSSVPRASSAREQSPSAVLREAKLRLRKLEIEAEVVERSYRHFRRRQLSQREDTCLPSTTMNVEVHYDQVPEQSGSQPRDQFTHDLMNMNLDKYLAKYQKEFDIGQTHFKNRNTAKEIKHPIPEAFIESDRENVPKSDYLEQPLTEFRQLYISKSRETHVENTPKIHDENQPNDEENKLLERREELIQAKQAKEKEPDLLQRNITRIYDLHDEPTKETVEPDQPVDQSNFQENLLKVEFENTEIQALKDSDDDILVVVASSAEPIAESRSDVDNAPPMAIIVSPKLKEVNEPIKTLSPSPDRLVQKEVFNAFLDAGDQVSNDENQEELETGGHYSGGDDYADDFSADVDNYNNKSEYDEEPDSPVSLPKSSEDENFWE